MVITRCRRLVFDISALGTGFLLATPPVPVMAAPFMGVQ